MTSRRRARPELVRPYLITGGRAHPSRHALDLTTLVRTTEADPTTRELSPEGQRAVRLCSGGALSVAEIAAHLGTPPSVTRVLVADLIDDRFLTMRTPAQTEGPDGEILRKVLDGLRSL
ncbi:DNA-directed RNA polymerase specialized sigma24 family protein [Saccharopolyspora lacisalsi]|uniref:DNA-directed RNA polymerase specialized sigma24 family protein n=1 Tax=Halosaccharopolyspora lacisalsi TaxID=1000566 RepID=A0A839DZR1_9PSEU|nr:DUF742 domain-containing protein [Halosaccharopolyspora lacisalsi]MBA8824977.1 DNA-directed RNA polymerase specialized sigma24 family protein [Halosaccharopolyspora lacisalsi]